MPCIIRLLGYYGYLIVLLHVQLLTAFPPPPPLQCTPQHCTISNAYGLWPDRSSNCRAASVAYPTTESQLISAVAHATRNRLKVKVVTKFSHTIPKLACPTTTATHITNTSFATAMFISTEHLNSVIEVEVDERVVTVDSGVGLRELIDRVEESGLSLVAAPYWDGVSIGGAMSTGSFGSSWWGRGGALHDYVVGIDLVVPAGGEDGFAKVVRLTEKDDDDRLFKAAKVSLGVLGVISKVKLTLEPAFKRSITYNFTSDSGLEDEYVNHGKTYEFGDITWYPSKHTAVYRYDHRVPLATQGNGVYDFIGFQPQSVLISKSVRATEKAFETARNIKGKCTMATTTILAKKLLANGLKNNNFLFTGYPVIGPQSKMQTSGTCHTSPPSRIDASCAWDPRINGLSFFESTFIFPVTTFKSFLTDVKKLRDIDPDGFCNIDVYNGFLIRYVKGSDAYLGQPVDSVSVDFNYFRADEVGVGRLRMDVLDEVEQMAFRKYGGRPHWAKNRPVGFYGVMEKYPGLKGFVDVMRGVFDVDGVFSSGSEEEVLFGREGEKFDGCGLEGLCICDEDRHCSPQQGYYCRPGRVYTEARVCRAGS